MKVLKLIPQNLVFGLATFVIIVAAGVVVDSGSANATNVIHVPGDFNTIQAAVDAAQSGDIIRVANGNFSENVLIDGKSDIKLFGSQTLLESMNGVGIGIHVLDSEHIRVRGFIVDGFEAGIVLEDTDHSHLHNIETRNNTSDTSTLRDGVQLISSNYNLVTNLNAHHNGHNGITLKGGSTNNTLRGNTSNDNGLQVTANLGGCGIQLIASDNDNNSIVANETLRNGWGIQIGGGSEGNEVLQNRTHQNQRAGVVALDPGSGNLIAQNNATGNGLADVAPSGTFDLFDQGDLDNTWKNNQGTSNF